MVGIGEIVFILVIVVLVFGAKRIPEIAKALGRASHEFKKAKTEIEKEADSLIEAGEKLAEKDDAKEERKQDGNG
ncbi:MAG: twin-arginine translocase TatA/TatE family subunit [Kiritimatiellae bacterium]|jgi:sec-independent protein translocase protein TatA|nr:twin-arginine translocase TatA/TatE family subunit [Kiritimatiellia bacterium]NLE41458.1 twin-arginine translocase TatA/TatE family subunit [Lentisphaerota bacterium]